MSIQLTQISFESYLRAGEIRGTHYRPWAAVLSSIQIAVIGDAPTGGDLVFVLMLAGVDQVQQLTVPAGSTLVQVALDGVSVAANVTRSLKCITASGASNVVATLFEMPTGEYAVSDDGPFYISIDSLTPNHIPKLRLLQLVDDEKEGFDSQGQFRASHLSIIEDMIRHAELEAEGYAAKRYSVAALRTTKPAALIVRIIDLSLVNLYERRPPLLPDAADRRKDAIAWLNGLKTGGDSLGLDTPVAEKPANAGGLGASIHDPKPQMDHHSLEGF